MPCDDIAAEGRATHFFVEELQLNELMIKFECMRLPFCHVEKIQYYFTSPPPQENKSHFIVKPQCNA
jgi:hypothetical protein